MLHCDAGGFRTRKRLLSKMSCYKKMVLLEERLKSMEMEPRVLKTIRKCIPFPKML
uniref:Uncharacterized protein n=1 Tax=Arundo donax TaxID=35708 RepID=A0A0A9ASB4_ARUDO